MPTDPRQREHIHAAANAIGEPAVAEQMRVHSFRDAGPRGGVMNHLIQAVRSERIKIAGTSSVE
jgi:hypothetical protein